MNKYLVTFINPLGLRYSERLEGNTAAEAIRDYRMKLHSIAYRNLGFDKATKNSIPGVWEIQSL